MITAKELRNLAWNDLKREGNYGTYVKAGFVCLWWTILSYLLAALPFIAIAAAFGICFGGSKEEFKIALENPDPTMKIVACLALTVAVVAAVLVVCWFVCWMTWGLNHLSLSCVRGKGDRKEIYLGRPHAWRMLDLLCWQGVYVLLWSLLFVIPGIVAQLSYSQAKYLIVDHPDWTAKECLAESKRLMYGNRWRYFCFCFSYFWWYLLHGVTMAALNLLSGGLGGLVSVFINPYYSCGGARFYRDLVER